MENKGTKRVTGNSESNCSSRPSIDNQNQPDNAAIVTQKVSVSKLAGEIIKRLNDEELFETLPTLDEQLKAIQIELNILEIPNAFNVVNGIDGVLVNTLGTKDNELYIKAVKLAEKMLRCQIEG
jgi:hypothetical protein